MTGRQSIEDLLEELYAARVRGDLDAVVKLFAPNATFQVAGQVVSFIEFLDTALAAKVLAVK